MSDRPDFERQQDISNQSLNEVDTAVTTEQARSTEVLEETRTAQVPSGDVEPVEFEPPPGTVFTILGFGFSVSLTSGSGDHSLRSAVDSFPDIVITDYQFPGSSQIAADMIEPRFQSQATDLYPPTAAARISAVRGVQVDRDNPFILAYLNNSGSAQNGLREYQVLAEQVRVD